MEASSSPARGTKGIGKLVNKVKSVLGKRSTSHEVGGLSHLAVAQHSSAPASEQRQDMPADTPQACSEVIPPETPTMVALAESHTMIEADTSDSHDMDQILLAKSNLDIARPRWPARNIPPVERVSRPIRLRVRYTCHQCKTSFGHEKECNSCRHRRCARCDRYPPRKPRPNHDSYAPTSTPAAPVEEAAPEIPEPIAADSFCTCHECQTVLEVEVEECPNCHHTICEKCHKEARLQSVDMTSPAEEEERKAQPEEQKLPPDSNTAEEQPPTISR